MTRQEAIEELEYYNRWQKDVHLKSPNFIQLGEAIEITIRLLKEDQKIINFYESRN